MPKFRVNVSTTTKGMLFNVAASKAAAKRAVIKANEYLAQATYDRIMQRLSRVLQNPTGFYESRVQIDRKEIYRGVSDGGVVYGGWLEGVARNNKNSRFKGYHTFREVRQEVNKDKDRIVAPVVAQLVKELSQ
jgi:hypothetical protein